MNWDTDIGETIQRKNKNLNSLTLKSMYIYVRLTFSYNECYNEMNVEFFSSIKLKNGLIWNIAIYGKNVNSIMNIEKL